MIRMSVSRSLGMGLALAAMAAVGAFVPADRASLLHPFAPSPALADVPPLTLTYSDPVGDSTLPIDVTGMEMTFDGATGDYTIALSTDPDAPFQGRFTVNVNLYNPDAPDDAAFFEDNLNNFTLPIGTTATSIVLEGTSPTLLEWQSGDTVATNTEAGLGNPPGSSFFRSAAVRFDFTTNPVTILGEDAIAFGPSGAATIEGGEPPTIPGLLDDVDVLVEDGVLSHGQGNALSAKLDAALAKIEAGQINAACNMLGAFINQVSDLVDTGVLSAAEGEALIDAATGVRTTLDC